MRTEQRKKKQAKATEGNVKKDFIDVKTLVKSGNNFNFVRKSLHNSQVKDENQAGQATKGARGMPWHQEPTKDVTSCEKPRGAANKH